MAENELLKQINKELKVVSLENSEKEKARIKSEEDDKRSVDKDLLSDEEEKITIDNDNDKLLTDEEVKDLNELSDVAEEQTEDVVNDLEANVLSSDPKLLNNTSDVGHNEIDDVPDKSGVLNDIKTDKTSSFIDPDADDTLTKSFKVVDTTLGTFTVLNSDDKNVLLLDSNKQKIQISIEDFNNLNPFEVKDERLSSVNDFRDAYERDLEAQKEAEEKQKQQSENSIEPSEDEQLEEINDLEDFDIEFGESLKRRNTRKENVEDVSEQKNILSVIQKNLSNKVGVSETIRSDVRSKNRCVLAANKAKNTKRKDVFVNETKPSTKQKRKEYVMESNMKNKKQRKEATQPSAICTPPCSLTNKKSNFDVDKVVTLKDGKYVLVKLEGKTNICYLKLKPKKNSLSINELKFALNDISNYFESLDCVSNNFYILEKEVIMKKNKKYESEELEEIENELDLEDEEQEDLDDVEEVDVEDDVVDEVEDDVEETPDSIPFSTEINGVRYSGTLYRDDDYSEDEEESEDEEDDEEDVDDSEELDDDDLILQSEEEIDDLDFPEGFDESVIKANASIYGNKYTVSFCNVKKECVKKAKLEMRKHNIMEAWNALVRGAKDIKC